MTDTIGYGQGRPAGLRSNGRFYEVSLPRLGTYKGPKATAWVSGPWLEVPKLINSRGYSPKYESMFSSLFHLPFFLILTFTICERRSLTN